MASKSKEQQKEPQQQEAEKDKRNQITKLAGLTFNVNTVKADIREYYQSQNLPMPMFSSGQVAVTAMLEKLLDILLKATLQHAEKAKDGIKQIVPANIQYAILTDPELKRFFQMKLEDYNDKNVYANSFPVNKQELTAFLDNIDKTVKLDNKGANLMTYLLVEAYHDVLVSASHFLTFAKKRSMNGKCVLAVVNDRFPSGLSKVLETEIVRAVDAVGDVIKEGNEEEGEAPAEEEAKKEETKKEETKKEDPKKKETKKTGGQKAPKIDDEEDQETTGNNEPEKEAAPEPEKPKPAPKKDAAPKKETAPKNNKK